MRTTLVLDALRMALAQRGPGADVELVHHSDAGSQYTSGDYTQALDDHDVLASIGTVGDALDNALAESFVDSFKTELIRDRVWRTRTQLEFAIVEYVGWFNHARLHSASATFPRRVRVPRSDPIWSASQHQQHRPRQIKRSPRNPGRLSRIASADQCADAQARSDTCPANAKIGDVTVGAGAGSNPFFIQTGRAYVGAG